MPRKKTPTEVVKLFCKKNCCCGVQSMVKNCNGKLISSKEICPLHAYRLGKGRISVKTIRKHCLYFCMGGSKKAVRECESVGCPLYKFRMGTNPNYDEKDRRKKSEVAKKFNLSLLGLKSKKEQE